MQCSIHSARHFSSPRSSRRISRRTAELYPFVTLASEIILFERRVTDVHDDGVELD